MALYKILNQTNKAFDPLQITKLQLLYTGGFNILENANLFMSQMASETDVSYEDRLKACSYLPYMSDVIDHYVSMLFQEEMVVHPAGDATDSSTIGEELPDDSPYKLFLAAADGKANSLEQVMRKVLIDALIHQCCVVGVDFPAVDEAPINLLEEEVMQAGRPYIYYIDPQCIINWQLDEEGNFIWTVIRDDVFIQDSPLDEPMHAIEFKIWSMKNGTASWDIYRSKVLPLKQKPAPNDDIPLVDSGSTSFQEIPLLRLCLPDGLAMGNKVGPICQDIFQRTSILVNGENKSINAMRIVFLGNEDDGPNQGMPSMVQENPFRALSVVQDWEAKGIGVLGANDDMKIIESEGKAFQIVADQIDKLVEKLKEVVHQMGNSASRNAKATGRSALSKQEDRRSTEILLTAYGNVIRDFVKHMMACISTARGESILWTIGGLDNFSIIDRDQLILECAQFPQVRDQSLSPTFTKLYMEKFYFALLDGVSNEDADQIRDEIVKAVDSGKIEQMKLADQQADAKSAQKEAD